MPTSPVEIVLTFSTGLVAFALGLSGVSKVGRSASVLSSMAALRVPVVLRRMAIAEAVPFVELSIACALLLLPGAGRQTAGVAAAAVLTVFTILLIDVLRRGDEVDCGCFGALSFETRVTSWSVGRNLALVGASVMVALLGTGSGSFVIDLVTLDAVSLLASALAWAMIMIIVLARAVTRAPSSAGQTRPAPLKVPQKDPPPLSPVSLALGIDPRRPGEVSMGDQIPHAELVSARGQVRTLADLANGRPTLLIFLSVECGSCAAVAESVPAWRDVLGHVEVLIATSSQPDAIARAYPEISGLTRFGSYAALTALGVQRSPAAVLLGGQQQPVIASPLAYGLVEIDALIQGIVAATRT